MFTVTLSTPNAIKGILRVYRDLVIVLRVFHLQQSLRHKAYLLNIQYRKSALMRLETAALLICFSLPF